METFAELDLIAPLQQALSDVKYTTPTPVQAKTIPTALTGRDILGCAQTGTGKTAAFALPLLNKLGSQNRKAAPHKPFALILAPTRELAVQIGDSFQTYGKHRKLRTTLVYGGVGQGKQVRALQRGTHILVATPGRLLDLMNQGHIKLNQLSVFVLDEADRMLDMGFLPDIKRVIQKLPQERQSLFFSATLAPKIVQLSRHLLNNPYSVNVTPKETSVEKIEQTIIHLEQRDKQRRLEEILDDREVDRALVFTRTKRNANAVTKQLLRSGVSAAAIHGNKSQNARQRALDGFRSRKIRVLVATDVASRGIDIPGVTHVVNFDLPVEPECYVHRIGRTGRAGAEGIAISFCNTAERPDLQAIEKLIGHKVPLAEGTTEPKFVAPAKRRSSGGGKARRFGGGPKTGTGPKKSKPRRRRRSGSRAPKKSS